MTASENPVEDYFNESGNEGKRLSVKTLSRRLNLRKKDVYYYILSNPHFQRVDLMEVGNFGKNSRVFCYVG